MYVCMYVCISLYIYIYAYNNNHHNKQVDFQEAGNHGSQVQVSLSLSLSLSNRGQKPLRDHEFIHRNAPNSSQHMCLYCRRGSAGACVEVSRRGSVPVRKSLRVVPRPAYGPLSGSEPIRTVGNGTRGRRAVDTTRALITCGRQEPGVFCIIVVTIIISNNIITIISIIYVYIYPLPHQPRLNSKAASAFSVSVAEPGATW